MGYSELDQTQSAESRALCIKPEPRQNAVHGELSRPKAGGQQTDWRRADLDECLETFLLDLLAAQRRPATIAFYTAKLRPFIAWLREHGAGFADEITSAHLRAFLIDLNDKHNAGGISAFYRAVRAFTNFLQRDGVLNVNPLNGIRAPRVDVRPLDPIPLQDVRSLLATCDKSLRGLRDRSIILTLIDTGMRASEATALSLGDFDRRDRSLVILQSKARRPRTVFLGSAASTALRHYLRTRRRTEDSEPLWLAYHKNGSTSRLTYWGLRDLLRRRAKKAGIDPPSPHAFRRAFALACLRSGLDLVSLRRLLGHQSTQVLERYLQLDAADLGRAHRVHSPGDALQRLGSDAGGTR